VIQLRHRQPSLWHSGLAKDIEDLWEPWMKEVTNFWKTQRWSRVCMMRKESAIQRAGRMGERKHRRKWRYGY
jgi:hypothetical protein